MKLSYLIASIHGEAAVKTVVEDIYSLPKHDYPDSWMGFYEEMINGDRPCEELGPKNVYLTEIPSVNQQNGNSKFDSKDKNTFLELVKLSNSANFNYNTKI